MSKIRYEEKVKAIKEIESGEKSITGIAKELKVDWNIVNKVDK